MTPEHGSRFTKVRKEDLAHLGTEPVVATTYYDPANFERERQAIFRQTWLMVGRSSEISEPNTYVVRSLAVARASILLTRTSEGILRAFYNVCTHRGAELVSSPGGDSRSFSCRYHRWNFSNDGSLRAVPDEKSFYSLDKGQCGLRRVSVDEIAGFVFVNLNATPEQTLSGFLGPLADDLLTMGFDRFQEFAQYSCLIDANWKTAFNNFQETYHVRWVHAPSAGDLATSAENPFGYPSDFRTWGPHGICQVWAPDLIPEEVLPPVHLAAIMASRVGESAPCSNSSENLFVFPNLFISPLHGADTFTMQYWPLSVDRTRIVVRVYRTGPDRTASMRFRREFGTAFLADVHSEDLEVIEATQRGLQSGALEHIHFQAQEALCRHFQSSVATLVASYPSAAEVSVSAVDQRE